MSSVERYSGHDRRDRAGKIGFVNLNGIFAHRLLDVSGLHPRGVSPGPIGGSHDPGNVGHVEGYLLADRDGYTIMSRKS